MRAYYLVLLSLLFASLVSGLEVNQTICLQAGLNIRDSPCGTIIQQSSGDEKGAIVTGPKTLACGGATYTWWGILLFGDNVTYWVADTDNLIQTCSISVCFQQGLNMRNMPCGSLVGVATGDEKGKITGAPEVESCDGGSWTWWEVDVTAGSVAGDYVWVAQETGLVSTSCGGGGGNGTGGNGTYANDCPLGYSPRDPSFEKAVPCNGPNGLGCCCNEFVEGMFGNFSLGTSGDMFTTLPEIGWCACNSCIENGIATNPDHVAFVYGCNPDGGVELYGANQSCQDPEYDEPCFSQCGCDNVSILTCCYNQTDYDYFHPSCCGK